MSWQRILEAARRHGSPIIVTDPAGREPLVVMPLSDFEESTHDHDFFDPNSDDLEDFLDEEDFFPSTLPDTVLAQPQPDPATDSDLRIEEIADAAVEAFEREVESSLAELETEPEEEKMAELSLEERFSIEPIDEAGEEEGPIQG